MLRELGLGLIPLGSTGPRCTEPGTSPLSSADNKGAGFPAPFVACVGTTQEVLAQRTLTWKLSSAAPSLAIVTWKPSAKGSASWTANDAATVRSAEGSVNTK